VTNQDRRTLKFGQHEVNVSERGVTGKRSPVLRTR
jgi:hypothetical protein